MQADGTFGLNYSKRPESPLGYYCKAKFRVYQHERDIKVLNRIIMTLACGNLIKSSEGRKVHSIAVNKISDLTELIILFFCKIPYLWGKIFRL